MSRKPQIVAHRGASQDQAEHTLAAYLDAIACGADALEADVRLTRDGHLVCVHDRRVDRTSDGRGVVSTLELADLTQLDFASWRDRPASVSPGPSTAPAAASGTPAAEEADLDAGACSGILTLRRLCEVVADCGRRVELAIETKHPTRYAGQVERSLVELLAHFGWASSWGRAEPVPVRIMSFSSMSLRRVHRLAPTLATVQLLTRVPLLLRDAGLPPWVSAVGPDIEDLRVQPSYVADMHARGREVHVWTVNRADDVALCLDLAVDAIITNRPASVLEQLACHVA